MFKQTFKTNFMIKQFEKLISPITTESRVHNVLTTNLKLDENAIKILHKNKVDSKLRKIPEEQIIRNCIILQVNIIYVYYNYTLYNNNITYIIIYNIIQLVSQ